MPEQNEKIAKMTEKLRSLFLKKENEEKRKEEFKKSRKNVILGTILRDCFIAITFFFVSWPMIKSIYHFLPLAISVFASILFDAGRTRDFIDLLENK